MTAAWVFIILANWMFSGLADVDSRKKIAPKVKLITARFVDFLKISVFFDKCIMTSGKRILRLQWYFVMSVTDLFFLLLVGCLVRVV